MYLSDLEIFGFKSFGKKTKLKFTDGLTCIVGPNGCGKTNIVDGIRWVLGEQRSSVMRSDIMENVIFNGNSKRRPLGMAEVVMTIQNNRNILPTEYQEVEITRRLFRDGNSNYLINGQRSRLKDIHNLFMDTGMGANSYSVIELKMVEAILSGKAEERRQLLEEAAGVVRYKNRRKEATRKLNSVQQDLERLADIETEVGKQVNSLQRQASKTRRYNEYVTELKSIELQVMAEDLRVYIEKAKSIDEELSDLRKEANKYEFLLTDQENALTDFKDKLEKTQVELAETRGRREQLLQEIASEEKNLAVASQQSESADKNIARIESDIENSSNIRENAIRSLEGANARLERYSSDIEKMEASKSKSQEAERLAKKTLDEARTKANSIAAELGALQSQKQSNLQVISRLERRVADIENRDRNSDNQLQAFDTSALELDSQIKNVIKEAEEYTKSLDTAKKDFEAAQTERDDLKEGIDAKNSDISSIRSEISNQKSTLSFYNSLHDSGSVSEFLRKSGWGGSNTQLAELVAVDEKYRVAIGALLNDVSTYFVVDDIDDAERAISLLNDKDKGKANFLIKKPSTNGNPKPKPNGSLSVLDIIRMPQEIEYFIKAVFRQAYIAKTDSEAKKLVAEDKDIVVVTLDGTLYSGIGRVRGGSKLSSESMMIGKQEKINEANEKLRTLEAELDNLNTGLNELIELRDKIDLNMLREKTQKLEREKRNSENLVSQLKIKKEGIGSRIELLKESIEKNKSEKQESIAEIEEIKTILKDIDKAISAKSDELDIARSESDDRAKNLDEVSRELRESELQFVKLKSEIDQADKDKKRLQRSLGDIDNRIKNGSSEISELRDMAVRYARDIEFARSAAEEKRIELSETENILDQLKEVEKDVRSQFQQEESALRNTRKLSESAKENLHKKDLEINEINLRISNLKERAQETHETDLEKVELSDETLQLEESRNRVADLKQKLQNIGSVNFMALEEYEETKERHTFMVAQIADLTESEKTLQNTIEEINETAEKLFIETFDKIRQNFRELFNSLFDGDAEADLELVGENPLESDIQITAKPPGKKPHSIEMLSGGEKTLTAISLLFAIYMVKPSPFCILDEVDAPLDDANIGRFVSLLRRFSKQTQFLIVTHNKKTMEAADNLYGVTQQEKGLSQVVSVKIDGQKGAA
jgi:chromosome segregation protein